MNDKSPRKTSALFRLLVAAIYWSGVALAVGLAALTIWMLFMILSRPGEIEAMLTALCVSVVIAFMVGVWVWAKFKRAEWSREP